MLGLREFMMREAEVVGASDQIHPGLKRFEPAGRLTRAACQVRHPLSEGRIQTLNESGVENAAPARSLQQVLCRLKQPMSHAPRHLDHTLFLGALDDRSDVQLGPDLQTRSSRPCCPLDLLTERSLDAAWIGTPAVCQHEQGTQGKHTSANLSEQLVSQASITRVLDHTGDPQARRNHHGQTHPSDHLASFHPNFIGLHVHQIQVPLFNETLMHVLTMHSSSITPISYRPFIQTKGVHNGLDRASVGQKSHDNDDEFSWLAQALKHGSSSGAKCSSAHFAAIALPATIMDDDVVHGSLASCGTRRVRAKYPRRVHWLWCTFLHKHILPRALPFFNSPPFHRLVGSYRLHREALNSLRGIWEIIISIARLRR
jgi:hypothetical protein